VAGESTASVTRASMAPSRRARQGRALVSLHVGPQAGSGQRLGHRPQVVIEIAGIDEQRRRL
jgi:hypothetical protein